MKNIQYIIDLFDDKVNPNHYEGDHLKLVEDARAELEELASKTSTLHLIGCTSTKEITNNTNN